MDNVTLHCGDSLVLLKDMPDCSVDMVVTSPPYDNLRDYNSTLLWNKDIWEAIIQELYRVVSEGSVVVWVVGDATISGNETGSSFKQALFFQETGFNLHDTMVWTKDGGGAIGSNKSYTQNFEYMFVFSKGKIRTTNLIYDKPNKSFGKNKSGVGRRGVDGVHKRETRKPGKEYSKRNNYWYISPEKGEHPAVFPLSLANDHIVSWSNPGDLVLDPFMGSGTTGIASVQNGRRFVGMDMVQEYVDMAKKRIGQVSDNAGDMVSVIMKNRVFNDKGGRNG